MTQYILVRTSGYCDVLTPVAVLDEPFYEEMAVKLFPSSALNEVCIVNVGGQDIDKMFTDAQKAVANHEEFDSTRLSLIVSQILLVADEIAFWCGSDYSDLDGVHDSVALTLMLKPSG